MKQFDQSFLEEQQKAQRATIFRVYNYYRVGIAFLFLFLFLDPNLTTFVGRVNPDLFRTTILAYITVNSIIGIATLFLSISFLARPVTAIIVVLGDLLALTLLMSASGGVSSGLGNLLIFTLAFAGGMVHGRVSTVLPAVAFILTIYNEFYLFFLNENDTQAFFQAGLLGIVYFVTNILFQTLSRQLRSRQSEVHTLEQINQLIIEGMPTGVVVMNESTGEPRFMNQAAERYLSLETGLVTPQTLLNAVAEWRQGPQKRAVTLKRSAGPELVATMSELTTPEADILIFLEDSTEAQRQAQQLKLASLGRLSASIAHEIRNPLGAISHAAQLLGESDNLDKGDQRLCEIIQNHSVRMNDVIENVLQMSRRRTAEPRNIVLDDWLDDFVEQFEAGHPGQPAIEIALDHDRTEIQVDPSHLSQVLSNLCQNGLRYSEKKTGEAKLLIRVGREALDDAPCLEVIDFGEGVDEPLVENLFEPFYTTETTGTGLGLYLSKELCAANDAHLSYARAETGGSSFKISFVEH